MKARGQPTLAGQSEQQRASKQEQCALPMEVGALQADVAAKTLADLMVPDTSKLKGDDAQIPAVEKAGVVDDDVIFAGAN